VFLNFRPMYSVHHQYLPELLIFQHSTKTLKSLPSPKAHYFYIMISFKVFSRSNYLFFWLVCFLDPNRDRKSFSNFSFCPSDLPVVQFHHPLLRSLKWMIQLATISGSTVYRLGWESYGVNLPRCEAEVIAEKLPEETGEQTTILEFHGDVTSLTTIRVVVVLVSGFDIHSDVEDDQIFETNAENLLVKVNHPFQVPFLILLLPFPLTLIIYYMILSERF